MSGRRFDQWHLSRVVGDPAAAQPYWAIGRKLLGYAMDEAQRASLGVHVVRRVLPDGAVIIAEKIGLLPRLTIIPPQPRTESWRMFKTRAIVIATEEIVAVDLEQYMVQDDAIVRVRELNEIAWSIFYGDGLIEVSAGPDGSYYKPPERHAKGFFVNDFDNNLIGHLSVDDGSVILERNFPYGGSTNLLDSVMADPTGGEVYSYGVLSGALNAMQADALEVRAFSTGVSGGIRGDIAAVTRDGQFIYACEQPMPGSTYVTILRTADMTVAGSVNLTGLFGPGVGLQAFFPSEDGRRMYALGWISELYSPIPGYTDIASLLIVLDTQTMTVSNSRVYEHRGFYTAVGKASRDGKRIYVAEQLTGGSSGRFFVIDEETLDPIKGAPIDVYRPAYFPSGIGLSPDKKRYYVSGRDSEEDLISQVCIAVCDAEQDVVESRVLLGVNGFCWGMSLVTVPMSAE